MPIIPTPERWEAGKREIIWSQLHSQTLFQTTNKQGDPSQEKKKELLSAVTLGSNFLHLLLLNKSDTSWTCDQLWCRLPSAAHTGCLHSAPVSHQVGSLWEHLLFGASCLFHILLVYEPQNHIHLKIPAPAALQCIGLPGRLLVNFISKRRDMQVKGNCYTIRNTKGEP